MWNLVNTPPAGDRFSIFGLESTGLSELTGFNKCSDAGKRAMCSVGTLGHWDAIRLEGEH